jgi:ribose 5-phosphate isomerase B
MSETVAVASDHAGVELKSLLAGDIAALGLAVLDLGPRTADPVDYPDYAQALARVIAEGRAERGVLLCGTGNGMAMAANRNAAVRAALCHDGLTARLARQHNDANVLVLGARIIGPDIARDCLKIFLSTPFDGGRHARRVAKFS